MRALVPHSRSRALFALFTLRSNKCKQTTDPIGMSSHHEHSISRRKVVECMTWARHGVLWTGCGRCDQLSRHLRVTEGYEIGN
jgi:hypothetical protein